MKESVDISGVSETMLFPLYARYLESKRSKPHFYDATAVRFIENIDYDFSGIKKGKMNMWGCAARTIILDNYAKEFIAEHPDCAIINIACGLDDRFSRVDNGQILWYNIDFETIIELRKKIIAPHDRVTDISSSALDFTWVTATEKRKHVLMIAEGILMYFTQDEVKTLLDGMAKNFSHVSCLCELMTQWMVDKQKIHSATQLTGAVFRWGISQSTDVTALCPNTD